MASVRHDQLTNWLIPALLTVLVGILAWMGANIQDMSKTLAVAVSKIDDHDRRIVNLETLFLRDR